MDNYQTDINIDIASISIKDDIKQQKKFIKNLKLEMTYFMNILFFIISLLITDNTEQCSKNLHICVIFFRIMTVFNIPLLYMLYIVDPASLTGCTAKSLFVSLISFLNSVIMIFSILITSTENVACSTSQFAYIPVIYGFLVLIPIGSAMRFS